VLSPGEDDLLPPGASRIVVEDDARLEDGLRVPHADASLGEGIHRCGELLGQGVSIGQLFLHSEVVAVRRDGDLERK